MPSMVMFLGSLLTGVFYCLFFAMVYKVFSLSGELNEIKDMLREIRRNTIPPGSFEAEQQAALSTYQPPELSTLAAEIDREEKAYEVPADRVTILDPPSR